MRSRYEVIKRPIITEKGMGVKERLHTLVFEVNPHASKVEIREAVQAIFKVKVESIRTAIMTGKERRRGRLVGQRPDWKKAYVKLQAGEKMPEYAENVS
ncbi:MAG TPA: 50S ribosomal protein L23 [Terriglobales bacterium]|nr:50S ribosomal protein L23 [Terriglobales bacterium]